MTRQPTLSMPEPARQLWLRTRETIRTHLNQLQDGHTEYRIGGGTVLASRWNHRQSFDIDITVDEGTPLANLAATGPTTFTTDIAQLGGQARYNPERNKFIIQFHNGAIDIWARSPILKKGHEKETIEDKPEILLSTAQIIRGKLERADEPLVRDAYDILKAAEYDPGSLEAAINSIPATTVESIANTWHWHGPQLAADAATQLLGTPRHEIDDARTLGQRTTIATRNALYVKLTIRTQDGALVIETATAGGRRETGQLQPGTIDDTFEARGLNAHLSTMPPGADAIREYAKQSCGEHRNHLIFSETNHTPTCWRTRTASFNLSPDTPEPPRPSSASTLPTTRRRSTDPPNHGR